MTAPYYSDELVTLYHGDCREITEWLSADVLVTDPPYGRAWRQGDLHGDKHDGIAGDESTAVRDEALALWGTERRAIVFGDLMLAPPSGTRLVCGYRKALDSGVRGAMGGVRRDLEAIYLVGPWRSGIGGRTSLFATAAPLVGSPNGIVARGGGHPHTKPQDVLGELIMLTTGTVADPFSGGGSIAARRLDQGVLDFGASA